MRLALPHCALALAAAVLSSCSAPRAVFAAATPGQLAHVVTFELQEEDDAAALIDDCRRLLTDIPGVAQLDVGRRGAEFDRAANDREFDVLLVVVFEDRAAHDGYQVHQRHQELVATWAQRLAGFEVFDAWIE